MNITEAMRAVNEEYNAECEQARSDPALNNLVTSVLGLEYREIDRELAGYVGEILGTLGMPPGVLDPRLYQMARMVFRMGMRTQRKIDHPDQPTSIFWRSDQVRV